MSAGRRAPWVAGFSLALLLHAGAGALALLRNLSPDLLAAEDFGGSHVIEFELAPMAVEGAGEAAQESMASAQAPAAPEVEEQLSAPRQNDLPSTDSSPYEAPPDLQLAQQRTRKEDESAHEDRQPTEAMNAQPAGAPAADSAASVAGGAAGVAADTNAAPMEGSASLSMSAPESWHRAVMAHLGRHKRYPPQARAAMMEGEVKVRLRIDRSGQVMSSTIERSSGQERLDAAALDLIKRAQPLPALPASVRLGEVELIVPVKYRLR